MKKSMLLLMVVFLSIIFVMPGHAGVKKVAQTGLQFLKIDVGARAAAMGGAYSMVGQDATAMFYNPAGIAKMSSGYNGFISQTKWIAEITYNTGGMVVNLGNWGNVGVSFITCDYGDVYGTRVANNEKGFEETGVLNSGAFAVGLSYAKSLTDKFTLGGQVKYAYQHLGSNSYDDGISQKNEVKGLAFDFGTIFYPGLQSLRLGMSIRNFSSQFKYEEESFQLPLTFMIGAAVDVLDFMGEHDNALLIAIDAIHPRDYTERIHIGAEYLFMNMFAFRAGYKVNYDEESFSAGIGFVQNLGGFGLSLGYSYSDLSVFDAVNRISFGFSF